jgi:hypothetical protein
MPKAPERMTINQDDLRFDLGKSSNHKYKRDFITRIIEFKAIYYEDVLNYSESLGKTWETVLPDIVIEYRQRYEVSNNNAYLQISKLAMKLVLFGNMNRRRLSHLLISPGQYMYYCLAYGPLFAKWLKKVRSYSFLSSVAIVKFLDLENKIETLNLQHRMFPDLDIDEKYSYDEYFSESNLIHWKEEVDDYGQAFRPIEALESSVQSYADNAKEMLSKFKLDTITPPDTFEMSMWTSDSTVYNSSGTANTLHRSYVRKGVIEKSANPYGSLTSRFVMKRQIIPVGPGNYRDSWAPDVDTLFTIRSISHAMRQVVQTLPYSAMYDPEVAYRRKSFLRRKDGTLYFMYDFKKSGITVNRDLLTILGEILVELYPNVEAFKYIKYYANIEVVDLDGTTCTPPRGVGLGNANELFTCMQCVFGHIYKKMSGNKSIFFNDDGVLELSDTWQKQTIFILTMLKNLGLIVNLAKSVVSTSNVFCEDYHIFAEIGKDELDYTKVQNLVMPFAEVLYRPTTASAKRMFYSCERGMLGQGSLGIEKWILDNAIELYLKEFGQLDDILPYHLGGWHDFSTSNFSCLIEFIIDPRQYAESARARGYNQMIRRWSYFNVLKSAKGEGLLSTRSRIAYSGDYLENPMYREFYIPEFGSQFKLAYDFGGFMTPEEMKKAADDQINFRGLQNAKPGIRAGLAFREQKRRNRLFKEFSETNKLFGEVLSRHTVDMVQLLRMVKDLPDRPAYFSYPRAFITKDENIILPRHNDQKVYTVGKSGKLAVYRNLNKSLNSTLASISMGKWLNGSDPFIFETLWKSQKSGYLISNKPILRETNYVPTPPIHRAFCPNRKLFIAEIQTRTGRRPIEFTPVKLPDIFDPVKLFDAFSLILPNHLLGKWREIKRVYKRYPRQLSELFGSTTLNTDSEKEIFLDVIFESLSLIDESASKLEGTDDLDTPADIFNFVQQAEYSIVFEEIVSTKRTIEDILEMENDFYDYEDDESMFDPQDLDFDLDEEEYPDFESDDDNAGFNDIRKLAHSETVDDSRT